MECVYKVIQKEIILPSIQEKIRLVCFGDIHRFTASCDEDRWKWFLLNAKKSHTPHTYYLGLGDYMDMASTKEQKKMIDGELHSQTVEDLGEIVKRRNRALAVEMSFMKPNVLGLIEGNHGWRFQNGTTGTDDLADRMQTISLGYLCHYTLKIGFANRGVDGKPLKSAYSLHLLPCHGRAGGTTEGASVNQVDHLRRIFPVCDIYIFGHDHSRWAKPVDILVPTYDNKGNVFIKQKRQFLSRSGSFKKAYTPGKASYEVARLLKPADLGALEFEIGFHREVKHGDHLVADIKAII